MDLRLLGLLVKVGGEVAWMHAVKHAAMVMTWTGNGQ